MDICMAALEWGRAESCSAGYSRVWVWQGRFIVQCRIGLFVELGG